MEGDGMTVEVGDAGLSTGQMSYPVVTATIIPFLCPNKHCN